MDCVQELTPAAFCWTRFGADAGETIERILERKEQERQLNNGLFYWGVGNSVAPGIAELIARDIQPEVLFSPIKGSGRAIDLNPHSVVAWSAGETLDGNMVKLPEKVLVTSRGNAEGPPNPHYALVCHSPQPLAVRDLGRLTFGDLCNLVSGKPLGPSQVTAVVRRDREGGVGGSEYTVALRATLAAPYFVRLREPVEGSTQFRAAA